MFLTIHELYRAPGSPREFRVGTDGDAFVLFTAVMKASGIEYDSLVMSQVAPDVHIATLSPKAVEATEHEDYAPGIETTRGGMFTY